MLDKDDLNDNKDNYNIIFKLLKNNKWNEILKLLETIKNEIDINIRDRTNNYIINYAVMYNNIDLVKRLYELGGKIDILDSDERSILYFPIKYSYDELLDYLIEININTIGVNIIDIKDKFFNTPLHYAIKNKNIYAVKKLLENNASPNSPDNKGYNALHLAIFTRDEEIIKTILQYIGSINSKTIIGETALHLACNLQLGGISRYLIDKGINVNIQDTQHEFSALHYAVNLNMFNTVEKLLKNKANPNSQDVFGNSPLHYVLIEENYNMIDLFLKNDIVANFNLYNIDGKIPLHIILENFSSNIEPYLETIIEKSNLSLINNDGNSCLFLLATLDIWEKYYDILKMKRLDIYTKNKLKQTVLDVIQKKKQEKFIDLVVESYYQRLKKNPDSWKNEWENICSKDFTKDNKDKMNELNIKSPKDCINLIKKNILDTIELIKQGNKKCGISSYPLSKNKMCITLDEGETVDVCTFTGTTLDVLLGLIYLLKTHRNACSTLSTEFHSNENLLNFYKSIGVLMGSRSEFLNFEIVWVHEKLYLIDNFYDKINDCKSKKIDFIIIPLGIEMKAGSHANYIIYDLKNKTVERFEPHGSSTPPGLNYDPKILDELLESRFKTIDSEIKYYGPADYEPKIGFQLLDIFENNKKKIGDPGGFCALWAVWYVDMRLKYKDIHCKELIEILIKSIRTQNVSVKNMIRNYAKNIIELRDNILKKAGLDINDWLNDMFTDTQINAIIQLIQNEILEVLN
jgi:ankyrin repeat protein